MSIFNCFLRAWIDLTLCNVLSKMWRTVYLTKLGQLCFETASCYGRLAIYAYSYTHEEQTICFTAFILSKVISHILQMPNETFDLRSNVIWQLTTWTALIHCDIIYSNTLIPRSISIGTRVARHRSYPYIQAKLSSFLYWSWSALKSSSISPNIQA